jgi:cytochrome c biogenesis protein CcmG/thiol:disulfide interchange protein DsbE
VTSQAEGLVLAPPRRRRRGWGVVLLVVVVAAAGVVLAGRLGGPDTQPAVLVGHPAPPLQGTTLDGQPFDLTAWRGQVVLVNVWGSWCTPCRQETPLLATAYSSLHAQGLQVVGVDVRDPAGDARSFLGRYPAASWPSVADPDGRHAVDWGTYALPESYLVDRSGAIVAKSTGPLTAGWIDTHVVPQLGHAP